MQKFLLLKQNQVYDKIASYQSVLPEKLFINMYAYRYSIEVLRGVDRRLEVKTLLLESCLQLEVILLLVLVILPKILAVLKIVTVKDVLMKMTNLSIEIECWNFLLMNAYLEYHQPSTPTLGGKSRAWCVIALGDSNEAK